MAFTSPEFPGMKFDSLEELQAAREARKRVEDSLSGRTTVNVSDPEEEPDQWDSTGPDLNR